MPFRSPYRLTEELRCETLLHYENAKLRFIVTYVELRSDTHSDGTSFELRSGRYIRRYSGDRHAELGGAHEAHRNPLLLLRYVQ